MTNRKNYEQEAAEFCNAIKRLAEFQSTLPVGGATSRMMAGRSGSE